MTQAQPPTTDTPGPDPAPTPPAPPAPAPATDPTTNPPAGPGRDIAWYEREVERLRAENARDRTAAKTAAAEEARKALLAQLNGGSDAPVDPAALAAQIEQTKAERAALAAENTVLRVAPRLGANPDALVDSSTFMRNVAKLDTSAADYATQLETLIKTTIEAQPFYRAATAPAATAPPPPAGDPATGGAGQPAPGSPSGVDAMRALLRPKRTT